MQRFVLGWAAVAVAILIPQCVFAGNQEVAERIAANLRNSGWLQAYRIGVRYDEGTVWLRGHVSSLEQMNEALAIVAKSNGVRRVINGLTVAEQSQQVALGQSAQASPSNTLQQASGAVGGEQVVRNNDSNRWPLTMLTHSARGERSAQANAPAPAVAATNVTVEQAPRLAAPEVAALAERQEPMEAPGAVAALRPLPAQVVLQTQSEPQAQVTTQVLPTPVMVPRTAQPLPIAYLQPVNGDGQVGQAPIPQYVVPAAAAAAPVRYDQPYLPNYAWPSYAAYPNYAAVTYPQQYSPTAWPYIGPFYPYPQVPLGWRKVSLQWHDGWWFLDFDDGSRSKGFLEGLLRPCK